MSSKTWREQGGAAFPNTDGVGMPGEEGMSLRDYFAGQALAGHLASCNPGGIDPSTARVVSEDAYRVADAMLAARDKSDA